MRACVRVSSIIAFCTIPVPSPYQRVPEPILFTKHEWFKLCAALRALPLTQRGPQNKKHRFGILRVVLLIQRRGGGPAGGRSSASVCPVCNIALHILGSTALIASLFRCRFKSSSQAVFDGTIVRIIKELHGKAVRSETDLGDKNRGMLVIGFGPTLLKTKVHDVSRLSYLLSQFSTQYLVGSAEFPGFECDRSQTLFIYVRYCMVWR
ncbi:hypothetical protein B0T19DRAFT_434777 [Cercophora scortea]|uniref:Uncharacterized protein n=1 Tax=Cercophora scortea TaxID=314031 RepID=A0AAE0M2W8_9PEZI|nr:hypothetical protein B0T19DRAFT_434777 [Cercophora scortea]